MTRRGGPGSAGRSGRSDAEHSPEVPVGTGCITLAQRPGGWRRRRARAGLATLGPRLCFRV